MSKLLHRPEAGQTILQGDTRRAASHVTYLRIDTLLGVARDRAHRLFALEISECRLFDKKYQLIKKHRDVEILKPKRDSSSLASLETERGIRIEVMKRIR